LSGENKGGGVKKSEVGRLKKYLKRGRGRGVPRPGIPENISTGEKGKGRRKVTQRPSRSGEGGGNSYSNAKNIGGGKRKKEG